MLDVPFLRAEGMLQLYFFSSVFESGSTALVECYETWIISNTPVCCTEKILTKIKIYLQLVLDSWGQKTIDMFPLCNLKLILGYVEMVYTVLHWFVDRMPRFFLKVIVSEKFFVWVLSRHLILISSHFFTSQISNFAVRCQGSICTVFWH